MKPWLVASLAEIYSIQAHIQGMITENRVKELRGEALAYNQSCFEEQAELLQNISDFINDQEILETEDLNAKTF